MPCLSITVPDTFSPLLVEAALSVASIGLTAGAAAALFPAQVTKAILRTAFRLRPILQKFDKTGRLAELLDNAIKGKKRLVGFGGSGKKYVDDLVSSQRRTHILDGDATGGGHRSGTGKPGKTEFPRSWPDERVRHEITDVVTDSNARAVQITGPGTGTVYQGKDIPLNLTTKSGKPVRFKVTGRRGGVDIEVIYEPGGEGIVSGFPSWPNNSSAVVKNPG